jgi:hypothetical protein
MRIDSVPIPCVPGTGTLVPILLGDLKRPKKIRHILAHTYQCSGSVSSVFLTGPDPRICNPELRIRIKKTKLITDPVPARTFL